MTVTVIISYIVIGTIIGLLGRLVVPGRQPIGVVRTVGLGVVGAVVGGLIARAVHLGGGLTFVVSVLVAAVLVYLISGRTRSGTRA